MLKGKNIICFGSADWDNPYRTNQHHIMKRLAENNRVLFIESIGLRRPVFQKKDIIRIIKRLIRGIKGIKKINLYIYSPLVLPFHKYQIIRKFNNFILKFFLNYYIKKYKFDSPIIWTYIPNIIEVISGFEYQLLVYHCVDELSGNPLIPGQTVEKLEQKLLTHSDIVFVSSTGLLKSKSVYNRNIYYFPNICEHSHFSKALLTSLQVPEDIIKLPKPIIGFIGAISSYKLDLALLKFLAEKKPTWSFVLIGPIGEGERELNLKEILKFKNIYYFGAKPYEVLPSYLKHIDVCLLPNKLNKYTVNMFPMKFFEYLSAGKPIVATELPALLEFKDVCYFAKNKEEFLNCISQAITDNSPALVQKRIQISAKYNWHNRIKEMCDIIEEKLKNA